MIKNVQFASASQVRTNNSRPNQDREFVDINSKRIVVGGVWDGAGSYPKAEESSECARETSSKILPTATLDTPITTLYKGVLASHIEMREKKIKSQTTTNTFILPPSGELFIGNIGDSRACRVFNGNLIMLTKDDARQPNIPEISTVLNAPGGTIFATSNPKSNSGFELQPRSSILLPSDEILNLLSQFTSDHQFLTALNDLVTVRSEEEIQPLVEFQRRVSNLNTTNSTDFTAIENNLLAAWSSEHMVTKLLGANEFPTLSVTKTKLQPGVNILLFYTDGLGTLTTDEIREILVDNQNENPKDILDMLFCAVEDRHLLDQYCLRQKVDDDITVDLVKVEME
jgi:serine/threonine protein phosphatase PrpC